LDGWHPGREAVPLGERAELDRWILLRLDELVADVTGKLDTFAPRARVIHIDGDPAEIGKLRRPEVGIAGDLSVVLDRLNSRPKDISSWQARCASRRSPA